MKRVTMVLALTILSVASIMLQQRSLAYAQEATEGNLEDEITGRGIAEDRELAPLNQKLARMEARLATIERTRKIGKGEAQGLEQDMDDYGKSMKAAFDSALAEAGTAAATQGQKGSPARLAAFEDVAKRHEQRVKEYARKMETIQGGIQSGAVDLDDSVLDEMKPDDAQQFSNFLSDKARQQYQQRHPGKVPGKRVSLLDSLGVTTMAQVMSKVPCVVSGAWRNVYGAVLSVVSPSEAEAYYAGQCISSCWSRNWTACATCVVSSGYSAIWAYNSFVGCWNGCGTCAWWRPWGCVCKTGCLVLFVGRLA